MKKANFLALCFLTASFFGSLHPKITTIFIDITVLFEPNSLTASSYIGKIDSLRYIAKIGEKPSQAALFQALMAMPAKSKITTYNQNIAMPLILSDWLAKLDSALTIKNNIQVYLSKRSDPDIVKKVFYSIICMMLTADQIAHIQDIKPKVKTILESIKKQGIKIFLTGNWTEINALKKENPEIFKLFTGVFVSGDLRLIKPDPNFYTTAFNLSLALLPNQALWIETEPKFITPLQNLGYQSILFSNNNIDGLKSALATYKIIV